MSASSHDEMALATNGSIERVSRPTRAIASPPSAPLGGKASADLHDAVVTNQDGVEIAHFMVVRSASVNNQRISSRTEQRRNHRNLPLLRALQANNWRM